MSILTKQRRDQILNRIYDRGHVDVRTLAEAMTVSEATVRRDLRALADDHQLDLVYGGATLPRKNDYSFRSKSLRNMEAKAVIGRLAAELVLDNDQIFMDSGTTCFEMLPHLKRRKGVHIIANSTRLALEIGGSDLSL